MTSDPTLKDMAKPLRYSGEIWSQRLDKSQQPMVRQLVGLFLGSAEDRMYQASKWVLGEETTATLFVSRFRPVDVLPQLGVDSGRTDIDRGYFLEDGRIIDVAAGTSFVPPVGAALSAQACWILPRPAGRHPVLLISEKDTLVEGTGFVIAGRWMVFFTNPEELWPDGVMVGRALMNRRSGKASALADAELETSGRQIALYRKKTQNIRQFERALCEVAGLPVLDEDGVIVAMERGPAGIIHWLDDGRSFILPGDVSPYEPGTTVRAGSGHVLSLRHSALQGPSWWEGRPWAAEGIPLFVFRPGFYGISIKDEYVGALAYRDGGGGLRARLFLGQEGEDEFWTWQAAQEILQPPGVVGLAALLGLSAEGDTCRVNALDLFLRVCDTWAGVIETTLDQTDPKAYRRVLDFVERERPAGSAFFVRGSKFDDLNVYAVFLDTGEQVVVDGQSLSLLGAY